MPVKFLHSSLESYILRSWDTFSREQFQQQYAH